MPLRCELGRAPGIVQGVAISRSDHQHDDTGVYSAQHCSPPTIH
jgi:hypothetical protein